MLSQPGPPFHRLTRPGLPACSALLALLSTCPLHAQTALPASVGSLTAPQMPAAPAQKTGTISGQVMDSNGAMIAGATITLSSAGTSERPAVTDSNGRFLLRDVSAGPFSITISLPGFTSVTQAGALQPGQTLALPAVALSIAVVKISVNAVTVEELALEELHTEEHQRLAGVLPNFFVSYNWTAPPLTSRQKFVLSTHNATDPGNLALVGTVAGVQQAANAFPGYHQGAAGYGKRYGADLANLVIGTYMGGAVLPSLLHQDPRYFYKGTGSKRSRLLYALSRSVITRGDNGQDQPNFAGILGDLSAAAISNAYYPASDRQGATLFFENGILAIGGDAMNNLVQEFVFNRITTKGKNGKAQPEAGR